MSRRLALFSGRAAARAALLLSGVLALAVASCGSRTGLFGPDPDAIDALPPGAGLDASTDGGQVPCVPGRFSLDLALTQLMFVVDRSGSMAFTLDGRRDERRSLWRWSLLQDALRRTLPTFDQQIAMGAKFFPEVLRNEDRTSPTAACRTDTGVGIPPARGNAAQIISVFDRADPLGGTPTAEAVRIAAQFLSQSRSVARTIVLATDGAPNCNSALDAESCVCTVSAEPGQPDCRTAARGSFSCLDDDRAVRTIRTIAEDQKIPVYVIGIGSTERPEFLRVLDDMAVAGGRPRSTRPLHYNVQSAGELTNALGSIRDSVARCTYLTPSAPVDPDRIVLEIDGLAIARDPTHTSGWDWVDRAFGWIAFFGEACARAQGSVTTTPAVSGVVSCQDE
jgi:hypothetical protein